MFIFSKKSSNFKLSVGLLITQILLLLLTSLGKMAKMPIGILAIFPKFTILRLLYLISSNPLSEPRRGFYVQLLFASLSSRVSLKIPRV